MTREAVEKVIQPPALKHCPHLGKWQFEVQTGFTRCCDCGGRFLAPAPPRAVVRP